MPKNKDIPTIKKLIEGNLKAILGSRRFIRLMITIKITLAITEAKSIFVTPL
ncbi:MAG: hypothetical protein QXD41_02480 [Nitrososphaeria archaeon]